MAIARRERARSYKSEAFRLKSKCVLEQVVRDRWGSGDGVSALHSENENLKQRAGKAFLVLTSKIVR